VIAYLREQDEFKLRQGTNTRKNIPDGGRERRGAPIRMVPGESAVCSASKDYNIIEICADHFRMIKFRSKYDKNYQRVIIKINEMMMVNHEAKLSKTSLTPMETVPTKHYEKCEVQERLQGGSPDSS
jgi:hypothetical protein